METEMTPSERLAALLPAAREARRAGDRYEQKRDAVLAELAPDLAQLERALEEAGQVAAELRPTFEGDLQKLNDPAVWRVSRQVLVEQAAALASGAISACDLNGAHHLLRRIQELSPADVKHADAAALVTEWRAQIAGLVNRADHIRDARRRLDLMLGPIVEGLERAGVVAHRDTVLPRGAKEPQRRAWTKLEEDDDDRIFRR